MIKEFKGEFFFLSNFYPCKVTYSPNKDMPPFTFQNTEAAFQAMKTTSVEMIKRFETLAPNEAKRLGRMLPLRKDWEVIKEQIMYDVVKAKFSQNPDLCEKLIATGDKHLVEGNTWNDKYWGVCLRTNEGLNKLGQILERVRSELR